MPFIPNFPGVPPLTSYISAPIIQLVADAVSAIFAGQIQWGIYLDGIPVIAADNQVSFAYKQAYPISTYPVEDGGFQSYDKVQLPSEIKCRFSAGGDVLNRQAFLLSIDAAMFNTFLYDVVTPEHIYINYNFTHRDFAREAQNVGLIVVDLWLTEIVVTSTNQFQNTLNAANAGQISGGFVTPQPPSSDLSGLFATTGAPY